MKRRVSLFFMVLAGSLGLCASNTFAAVDVSAQFSINSPADFYDPLASLGAWVDLSSYGRCWHPRNVARDWRPYCNGEWEWTDAGWYWASDEPWAWACYHYGSWVDDAAYGWCWIPGTEWAPAWVDWREGPDYIGWAPCGPSLSVLAPSAFVFVDIHHFHDHIRPGNVVINNREIINRTRVMSDFRHEDHDFGGGVRRRIAVNAGPSVDTIQHDGGAHFTPRPISDAIRQTPAPKNFHPREARPEEQPHNPTGREQQRVYPPTPAKPPTPPQPEHRTEPNRPEPPPAPENRDQHRDLPPTGRDQSRVLRDGQPPDLKAHREIPSGSPQTPPAPVAPKNERPLPPTGREQPLPDKAATHREVAPPREPAPVHQAPPAPVQPPDRKDGDQRQPQ